MFDEVKNELTTYKGDKKALMKNYTDQMNTILKLYGGNFSDVPIGNDSEYTRLQNKMHILNRMG